MKLVILSGKGGTGKTTISVNLANIAMSNAILLDCDVEEPNSNLFINSPLNSIEDVKVLFPKIDEELCIHCGECGNFCNFNAILNTKVRNIIMPELCHDCGGCKIVCPVNAITYESRTIGYVRGGEIEENRYFYDGILNTGEFSSTTVIESVLEKGNNYKNVIIDAPPGTACAAVEATLDADLALIVTEPTPFALSDMKMVVEMLKKLNKKCFVFINKSDSNKSELLDYCKTEGLQIIGELKNRNEYAFSYARGELLSDKFIDVKKIFIDLWKDILNECT